MWLTSLLTSIAYAVGASEPKGVACERFHQCRQVEFDSPAVNVASVLRWTPLSSEYAAYTDDSSGAVWSIDTDMLWNPTLSRVDGEYAMVALPPNLSFNSISVKYDLNCGVTIESTADDQGFCPGEGIYSDGISAADPNVFRKTTDSRGGWMECVTNLSVGNDETTDCNIGAEDICSGANLIAYEKSASEDDYAVRQCEPVLEAEMQAWVLEAKKDPNDGRIRIVRRGHGIPSTVYAEFQGPPWTAQKSLVVSKNRVGVVSANHVVGFDTLYFPISARLGFPSLEVVKVVEWRQEPSHPNADQGWISVDVLVKNDEGKYAILRSGAEGWSWCHSNTSGSNNVSCDILTKLQLDYAPVFGDDGDSLLHAPAGDSAATENDQGQWRMKTIVPDLRIAEHKTNGLPVVAGEWYQTTSDYPVDAGIVRLLPTTGQQNIVIVGLTGERVMSTLRMDADGDWPKKMKVPAEMPALYGRLLTPGADGKLRDVSGVLSLDYVRVWFGWWVAAVLVVLVVLGIGVASWRAWRAVRARIRTYELLEHTWWPVGVPIEVHRWLWGQRHNELLGELVAMLSEHRGRVALSGDRRMGKTSLLRLATRGVENAVLPRRLVVVEIQVSEHHIQDLYQVIGCEIRKAAGLGQSGVAALLARAGALLSADHAAPTGDDRLVAEIARWQRSGGRPVLLLLDEAQDLYLDIIRPGEGPDAMVYRTVRAQLRGLMLQSSADIRVVFAGVDLDRCNQDDAATNKGSNLLNVMSAPLMVPSMLTLRECEQGFREAVAADNLTVTEDAVESFLDMCVAVRGMPMAVMALGAALHRWAETTRRSGEGRGPIKVDAAVIKAQCGAALKQIELAPTRPPCPACDEGPLHLAVRCRRCATERAEPDDDEISAFTCSYCGSPDIRRTLSCTKCGVATLWDPMLVLSESIPFR